MKTALQFNFDVNKDNKTIRVTREFDANLGLVWDAWTKAELLDQWWAPKPYRSETRSMDFREGGSWIYAMIGPDNKAIWCRADFSNIEAMARYSVLDAFADESGNIDPKMPRMNWTNKFRQSAENTIVDISITCDELADLERIIEMGFEVGFTAGLGNLDELLERLKA